MSHQALKSGRYWFTEKDLVKPIDWNYIDSLKGDVKLALEELERHHYLQ